jgi:hypothetical protein
MLPFPLENNLFLLSSETLDGVVLVRHPHLLSSPPQKRAGPRRLGIHLFPHGHSFYSVHDHPNFRAVFYPLATGNAAIRRTILPNNRLVRWLSANNSQ